MAAWRKWRNQIKAGVFIPLDLWTITVAVERHAPEVAVAAAICGMVLAATAVATYELNRG